MSLKINIPKARHIMMQDRDQTLMTARLRAEMDKAGVDAMLLFRPENFYYATGYLSKLADNPGSAGMNIAVVTAGGSTTLVSSTLELDAAYSICGDGVDVISYPSWVFVDDGTDETRRSQSPSDIDAFSGIRKAVEVVRSSGNVRRVALETGFITAPLWAALQEMLKGIEIVDATHICELARMIKTPWEIKILRIAAQHAEKTMHRVAQDVVAGMPSYEMDNLMNVYGYTYDEHKTAETNLFASQAVGPYFGLSGIQRGYIVKEGDIVRFDGGFRHLGYSSDLGRCFAVGQPNQKAIDIYAALVDGYNEGIKLLRPGTVMEDVYHAVCDTVTRHSAIPFYPRGHSGHSIGMNRGLEEYPRFAPGFKNVLEPNMVVCVEAPIWTSGIDGHFGSFAIEDTFLITEDGCERFTHANETLIWH